MKAVREGNAALVAAILPQLPRGELPAGVLQQAVVHPQILSLLLQHAASAGHSAAAAAIDGVDGNGHTALSAACAACRTWGDATSGSIEALLRAGELARPVAHPATWSRIFFTAVACPPRSQAATSTCRSVKARPEVAP